MSCSPVIHPESGPARKTATAAMSAGCPVRPNEACAAVFFSQSEPMKPPARVPSVSTMPGLMELTRIFFGPSSRARTPVIPSMAALVPVYTALFGGVMRLTAEPMLMTLPPSPRCFAAACVVRSRPRTLTLNSRWNDSSVTAESGELVDAGVVHQDVELSKDFDGGVDDALRALGPGDVAGDGHGLASHGLDGGDHFVGAGLAGGVVDHDRRALRRQRPGDAGADALRCAGHHCDLACELAHGVFLSDG